MSNRKLFSNTDRSYSERHSWLVTEPNWPLPARGYRAEQRPHSNLNRVAGDSRGHGDSPTALDGGSRHAAGGEALSSHSPTPGQSREEAEGTTESDLIAERAVLDVIEETFPEHNTVSEESSPVYTAKPRWIIDPLDGTTNFLNGVPHYAVSVAFEGPAPKTSASSTTSRPIPCSRLSRATARTPTGNRCRCRRPPSSRTRWS
ncbi:inositol monophosphatase family protein [Halosimplex aquaticum]